MNEHYEINRETLEKEYIKAKHKEELHKFREQAYPTIGERFKEIPHLSKDKYKVYFEEGWGIYIVRENNREITLDYAYIEPKSIREKIHNIEEARKFYEQT